VLVFAKALWRWCHHCGGLGVQKVRHFNETFKVECGICRGSGLVRREYGDPLEAVGLVLADAYEIEYLRHTINAWWLHKKPGNVKLLVNFLLDACLHAGWLPASEPTP
jgi:hypothetical protein